MIAKMTRLDLLKLVESSTPLETGFVLLSGIAVEGVYNELRCATNAMIASARIAFVHACSLLHAYA